MPRELDRSILAAALAGYQSVKRRIEAQIAELRERLDGRRLTAGTPAAQSKPKRKFSMATRRRMAAAQRKRWRYARQKATGEKKRQAEAKAKRIAGLVKARKALAAVRRKAAAKKAAAVRK